MHEPDKFELDENEPDKHEPSGKLEQPGPNSFSPLLFQSGSTYHYACPESHKDLFAAGGSIPGLLPCL